MLSRFSNHTHLIISLDYLASNLNQLCRDRLKMLRNHILDRHITSGRRRRKHKGSRLDLIRNNRILRSMKATNTTDTDDIGSRALDICSHAVEEVCNIHNVRLLCRILKDCLTLCESRCHHDIDRCSDRNHIEIDRMRNHCPAINLNLCAQRTKSL